MIKKISTFLYSIRYSSIFWFYYLLMSLYIIFFLETDGTVADSIAAYLFFAAFAATMAIPTFIAIHLLALVADLLTSVKDRPTPSSAS